LSPLGGGPQAAGRAQNRIRPRQNTRNQPRRTSAFRPGQTARSPVCYSLCCTSLRKEEPGGGRFWSQSDPVKRSGRHPARTDTRRITPVVHPSFHFPANPFRQTRAATVPGHNPYRPALPPWQQQTRALRPEGLKYTRQSRNPSRGKAEDLCGRAFAGAWAGAHTARETLGIPPRFAQEAGEQAVYHLAGRRLPALAGHGCVHSVSDTHDHRAPSTKRQPESRLRQPHSAARDLSPAVGAVGGRSGADPARTRGRD